MDIPLTRGGSLFRRPIGDVHTVAILGAGSIALFLGLFFSAQAGLLFLAGAWGAVGTWRAPWGALLVLLGVGPFLVILKATGFLAGLTVLKDVVILTLFLRTLRMDGPRIPPVIVGPVCFLVGWTLVAFARSDALTLGLLRVRDLVLYIPLLVIVTRLVRSSTRVRTLVAVILGTAVLVLLLGAAQWMFFRDGMVLRFDPGRAIWVPRLSSVLAHPNNLGGYLLFVLPIAASLAIGLFPGGAGTRVTGTLLTAGVLVAVYWTYSRSAWIAHASALGALVFGIVWLRRGKILSTVMVTGVLLMGTAVALPQVRSLLLSVVDPSYASNRERLDFFAGVLARISPFGAIGGEGLGDAVSLLDRSANISLFDIIAAEARVVQQAKARTFLDNGVLKLFVEGGVIGIVIVAWVAVRLCGRALHLFRHATTGEGKAVGLATVALLAGLAPLWFFLDVPDMFPVNMYFWTFAGLVSAASAREDPEADSP